MQVKILLTLVILGMVCSCESSDENQRFYVFNNYDEPDLGSIAAPALVLDSGEQLAGWPTLEAVSPGHGVPTKLTFRGVDSAVQKAIFFSLPIPDPSDTVEGVYEFDDTATIGENYLAFKPNAVEQHSVLGGQVDVTQIEGRLVSLELNVEVGDRDAVDQSYSLIGNLEARYVLSCVVLDETGSGYLDKDLSSEFCSGFAD